MRHDGLDLDDKSFDDFDSEIERDCLKVILELCDEIRGDIAYFGDDEEDFLSNRRYQRSVAMSVIQIGERVKTLRKGFKERYDIVYWKKIAGMRDVVTHSYTIDFDLNRLWDVATNKLTELQYKCEERLAEIDAELGPDSNSSRKN